MQARDDQKAARERHTNLLLAFSGALGRSQLGTTVDKQRIVAGLGSALSGPGTRSLQPLHDLLVNELKVDPTDAAGISLFVKGCEARYGIETALPPSVEALSSDERATAAARFAARRADAANAGAFARPAVPAPGAAKAERTGKDASSNVDADGLRPRPPVALIAYGVMAAVTFVVAIPVGLGADEAGWGVTPMWAVRHALLLVTGIAVLMACATAGVGKAMPAVFGGLGPSSALALVGGVVVGLLASLISSAEKDASFALGVVLAISIVHAALERFAFFVLQRGLGGPGSNPAAAIVVAMQVVYVFTFAIVVGGTGGQMAIWMAYAAFTTAGPAALLSRNGSFWPGYAWHVGFMLANIGMS